MTQNNIIKLTTLTYRINNKENFKQQETYIAY